MVCFTWPSIAISRLNFVGPTTGLLNHLSAGWRLKNSDRLYPQLPSKPMMETILGLEFLLHTTARSNYGSRDQTKWITGIKSHGGEGNNTVETTRRDADLPITDFQELCCVRKSETLDLRDGSAAQNAHGSCRGFKFPTPRLGSSQQPVTSARGSGALPWPLWP